MQALQQAGYKTSRYTSAATDDARCVHTGVCGPRVCVYRCLLAAGRAGRLSVCAQADFALCRMAAAAVASTAAASFADARNGLSSAFASVPNTHFSTFDSRLKSFRQWPHSAAIRPLATPSALASQGFYFAPDDHYHDRVLCAFCNLELAEWGPKDDPIYEHGARAPVCPVVTGKFLSIQTRDPAHLKDIIHEEEANVAKLQVLQMGICLFVAVCERPFARCTPPEAHKRFILFYLRFCGARGGCVKYPLFYTHLPAPSLLPPSLPPSLPPFLPRFLPPPPSPSPPTQSPPSPVRPVACTACTQKSTAC
jgi:hypothetical protein